MASKRNLTIGLVFTATTFAILDRSIARWAIAGQLLVYGLLFVWRAEVLSYFKRQFAMTELARRRNRETKPVSPARLARETKIADQARVVRRLVQEHVPALSRNRRRLISVDEYGVADDSKWQRHVEAFFAKVVAPQLPYGSLEPVLRQSIRAWIDEAIDIYEEDMADLV